jgi:serine protease Do
MFEEAPAVAAPEADNSSAPDGAGLGLAPEVAAVLAKQIPTGIEDLRILEKQVQVVLKKGIAATVGIELGEWSGSGVVVSPDGLVLTAGHVVGMPDEQVDFVFPDGRKAHGRMLGINRELDCGMMKITSSTGPWPYVTPAPADTLRPGDWVVALGQPGGLQPDRTPPVRLGRVLCLDGGIVSTDCTLVGGDSGGPLLDLQGRLVGIHSRIGELVTSNLHVPIAAYHDDWSRLLAGEVWGGPLDAVSPVDDRPLFGLAGTDVPGSGGDGGCRVTQVFSDHPAALAGILVDDVLLKFDRQPVRSTRMLGQLLRQKKPGDRVAVELLRGSRTVTVEVLLGRTRRPLPGGPSERPQRNTRG